MVFTASRCAFVSALASTAKFLVPVAALVAKFFVPVAASVAKCLVPVTASEESSATFPVVFLVALTVVLAAT
ncbi:Uncharacterised protein [Acinetobacter baumannii]|nr:Uncharacterised protein [Acinetobacter baumannii]